MSATSAWARDITSRPAPAVLAQCAMGVTTTLSMDPLKRLRKTDAALSYHRQHRPFHLLQQLINHQQRLRQRLGRQLWNRVNNKDVIATTWPPREARTAFTKQLW